MSYTPSSLVDFITHFESGELDSENPFYYESSTTTINFGYGLNLTAAEDAALNGNRSYDHIWCMSGLSAWPDQAANFCSTSG